MSETKSEAKCIECNRAIKEEDEVRLMDFPLCSRCKNGIIALEMEKMRKLKFKEADFVVDNIFIGCENSAINMEYLKNNNIKSIIVAAMMCKCHFPNDIDYLVFDIDDDPKESIEEHFQNSYDFIKSCTDGNVLVHCVSGISRSATIVISYLMKEKRLTMKQGWDLLKSKRSIVHPNSGFQTQLIKYEKILGLDRVQ